VDELTPHTTGRAEAWQAVLEGDGYIRTSDVRSSVDEQGIHRAEFDMYCRNELPEIALIHAIVSNTNARALASNKKYAGVSISESEQDRDERWQVVSQAELQPRTGPMLEQDAQLTVGPSEQSEAVPQGVEKKLLIEVDEVAPAPGARGQAEAVKEAIEASGAQSGTLHSTTDE